MVKVFVACPKHSETGGVELLHQLCHELNQNNHVCAKIWYIADSIDNPQPEQYTKVYGNEYIVTSKPASDVVLVFPEIWTAMLDTFKNNQCVIFWESVDNYISWSGRKTVPQEWNKLLHLTQSFYASDFLIKNGIDSERIIYVSDYLNPVYMAGKHITKRVNRVLYNPKKGNAFTEQIIAQLPDIDFAPICDCTQQRVMELMETSKLYIDFGDHPGKDRMPREAAMCGCCIITDTEGSAKFDYDVSIPSEYKFDRNTANLPAICNKIQYVLQHYDIITPYFDFYRDRIKHEKELFQAGVVEFVKRIYKPRFSIIIPAYNSANYIRKALESVKSQVFTNYELIVVCDSCMDNTEEVAKEYTDKVIIVNNHCDGPTRNRGIEEACGDYILFMDDDDWWLHEYGIYRPVDWVCFSELHEFSRTFLKLTRIL